MDDSLREYKRSLFHYWEFLQRYTALDQYTDSGQVGLAHSVTSIRVTRELYSGHIPGSIIKQINHLIGLQYKTKIKKHHKSFCNCWQPLIGFCTYPAVSITCPDSVLRLVHYRLADSGNNLGLCIEVPVTPSPKHLPTEGTLGTALCSVTSQIQA